LTPLRSSSNGASKRNKPRSAARAGPRGPARPLLRAPRTVFAAALFLALVAAAGRAAPTLSVATRPTDDGVVAHLVFTADRPQDIVDSLLGGLESRIVFTIRLYQKRTGPLAFLGGDRLVVQTTLVRRAYRDSLTQMFVVEEGGQAPVSFATTDRLLAAFFTVLAITLHAPVAGQAGSYVAARAQVEPIRLMPPLTLVTLAGAAAFATAWVRSDVP
jgi:hypothetical protein